MSTKDLARRILEHDYFTRVMSPEKLGGIMFKYKDTHGIPLPTVIKEVTDTAEEYVNEFLDDMEMIIERELDKKLENR